MQFSGGLSEEWFEIFEIDAQKQQRDYHSFLSNLAAIQADWETFTATGEENLSSVRPEVLASWRRSQERKISPYKIIPGTFPSPDQLKAKLKKNAELINIASPFLETLLTSVNSSGFRVDILDSELCILKQFGDKEVLDLSCKSGFGIGAIRSEQLTGTNSISLAWLLKKPVQLVGPEHYNVHLHRWTCSSAPLIDQDNHLIGMINMSGHYSNVHMHTLGMVAALAKAIEFSWHQHRLRKEKELASRYISDIVDSISDGLIAINEQSQITVINRTAQKLLELKSEDVLEQPATTIFEPKTSLLDTIKSGLLIHEGELNFYHNGQQKTVFGNCFPINIDNQINGALAIFKDLINTRHLVKNAAGFKAYFHFNDLKGESVNFKDIVKLARQASLLPSNILLSGESGTGKELFAQAIHNESAYRHGPFIGINCAAIPADLIESELFGYEGGAFTGARREGRPGKMSLAEGGTLFLDEINSMSTVMQAKILRVLQNRTFTRIGGLSEIQFRARLIAATNCDLWEQVRLGNFREDLYYRLNVVSIDIPPLRFHKEDIAELSTHFCSRLKEKLGITCTISPGVLDILMAYNWPGNIRELENVIERSTVMTISRGGNSIEVNDLLNYRGIQKFLEEQHPVAGFSLPVANDITDLDSASKLAIEKALEHSRGNISRAAEYLGITRKTLYKKIEKYGITASARK